MAKNNDKFNWKNGDVIIHDRKESEAIKRKYAAQEKKESEKKQKK